MNTDRLLAFLAVIASSLSAYFAYLVWKDNKDENKYKLTISASRMTEIIPGTDLQQPVIAVKIVNNGKRPIKILTLYFKSFKQNFIINTPYLPKLLTESDDIVLSIHIRNIISNKNITVITEVGVIDSNKIEWKISEKDLSQLNKDISQDRYYQNN